MTDPSARTARWWRIAQVLVSVVVLVLLFRDVDRDAVGSLWPRIEWRWLGAALLTKSTTLALHELRLWVSLNPPRPSLLRVMAIGFASGVLNLVLPGRAGDLAAIGMLVRECRVRPGAAAAAVGVVAFLEAAMFGLTLVVVLALGADRWQTVVGPEKWMQAMSGVSGLTLLGVAVAVAAVILTRRFRGDDRPPPGPGPLQMIRDAIVQATDNLAAPLTLALNTGLALLQVVGMVAAFAMLFPAVGLDLPLPALAASGVLAISSLASVLLPPSYGAGPAAAAVFVLGAFGLSADEALAYSVGWWLVSQVPAVVLGVPAFYGRGERSESS
jgi:uncharacterized membrane protein YbhN (UPF0104 family)